jgi:hypothetical protein
MPDETVMHAVHGERKRESGLFEEAFAELNGNGGRRTLCGQLVYDSMIGAILHGWEFLTQGKDHPWITCEACLHEKAVAEAMVDMAWALVGLRFVGLAGIRTANETEARGRLRSVLPHLKIAAEMARLQVPGGTVGLGVVAKTPDGTGRITATFESEGFIRDLEMLVGHK